MKLRNFGDKIMLNVFWKFGLILIVCNNWIWIVDFNLFLELRKCCYCMIIMFFLYGIFYMYFDEYFKNLMLINVIECNVL